MLLRDAGHDVVGVTMKLWREGVYKGGDRDACFGSHEEEDIESARRLSERLGIEYRVFDCFDTYNREIIKYFRETYLAGRTPNPCVRCNAMLKFGLLPKLARESGLQFDRFATGHYARVVRTQGGRFAVARANGLAVADRPDSQDFYSGDQNELIGEQDREGDIVDLSGKVLRRHNGFWHYTIGQRKGLGIGGGVPYYVVDVNSCRNQVVVGHAQDTVKTELRVTDMVYSALSPEDAARPTQCSVKVRSAGAPRGPATLEGDVCTFPGGISGIARGQSAVFYGASGEILAGGIIS